MATEKLSDHADLPENAEEACQAVVRTLLPLTDFNRSEVTAQFRNLVVTISDVEENKAEAWERSRYALGLFARKAENEARQMIEAIDRALALARHADAAHREHARRIREGLPPSTGPTARRRPEDQPSQWQG